MGIPVGKLIEDTASLDARIATPPFTSAEQDSTGHEARMLATQCAHAARVKCRGVKGCGLLSRTRRRS
jgi:hypothetical protein